MPGKESPYGIPPDQVPPYKIVGNIWKGNPLTERAIAQGAIVENPTFAGISDETYKNLKKIVPRVIAMSLLDGENLSTAPYSVRKKIEIMESQILQHLKNREAHPRIQAAVVRSKDTIEGRKRLWYLMPGALSAAAQYSPTVANIYRYMNEQPGVGSEIPYTSEAIAFSSKAGIDTADQRMPNNIIESASYQAAFMLDLLKQRREKGQNIPDEIILVSHSLGGHDSIVAKYILEELLQVNDFEVKKVGGLIMVQPSGLYRRELKELFPLAKKAITEFLPLRRTVRTKYPLPDDIIAIQTKIDEVRKSGNHKLVEHLQAHRDAMLFRVDNPPDLNDEEKRRYLDIYHKLEGNITRTEKEKLMNELYNLLLPSIKRIVVGIRPKYWSDSANIKGLVKFLLRADDRFSAIKEMPPWIGELVQRGNVGMLFGGGDIDDEFFSYKQVKEQVPLLQKLFPYISCGIKAVMYNWSHADYPSRPEDFVRILGDLTNRLLVPDRGFEEIDYYLDSETGIRADIR